MVNESHRAVLHEIIAAVRSAGKVRSAGIQVALAGSDASERTALVTELARELGRDLHRVDLSAIISKYIGETEKNLKRVFDAAAANNAILLFDEADALFGKRSEVKDSHDRFANLEVSYLLQQLEAHRGLVILATKRKDSIDEAFLRRSRFVIKV